MVEPVVVVKVKEEDMTICLYCSKAFEKKDCHKRTINEMINVYLCHEHKNHFWCQKCGEHVRASEFDSNDMTVFCDDCKEEEVCDKCGNSMDDHKNDGSLKSFCGKCGDYFEAGNCSGGIMNEFCGSCEEALPALYKGQDDLGKWCYWIPGKGEEYGRWEEEPLTLNCERCHKTCVGDEWKSWHGEVQQPYCPPCWNWHKENGGTFDLIK
jgi:hypothetical protein